MSEERTQPLNTARGCLYATCISIFAWSVLIILATILAQIITHLI